MSVGKLIYSGAEIQPYLKSENRGEKAKFYKRKRKLVIKLGIEPEIFTLLNALQSELPQKNYVFNAFSLNRWY